jgi:hypothetical protein
MVEWTWGELREGLSMGSWEVVVAGASGALSALAALIAVYMAVRAEGRTRKVAAAQLYLELRSRLIGLYTQLGDMDSVAVSDAERKARAAFWHHCYDEWYLSTRFAPEEFGSLWMDFYKDASRSALGHAGLRSALEELTSSPHSRFAEYASGFIQAIGFPALQGEE